MDTRSLKYIALGFSLLGSLSSATESNSLHTTLPEVIIYASDNAVIRSYKKEDIEQSRARNAAEFLQQLPGVTLRDDAASGGKQFARIGGSNVNQVLVLLDGVRIDDIGSGETDLARIPVDWIESIEIVRGGSGFGAEAIGGVISIRTSTVKQKSAAVRLEGTGTFGELSARHEWIGQSLRIVTGVSRAQGNGRYRFRVTEYDGNGPFTQNLGQEFRRQNNATSRDRFFGKVENFVGRVKLTSTLWLEEGEFGLPGYLAPRPTPMASQVESYRSFLFDLELPTPKGTITTKLSQQTQRKEYSDPDPYSFLKTSREYARRSAISSSWVGMSSGIQVCVRVEGERESLESGILADDQADRLRWRVTGGIGKTVSIRKNQSFSVDAGLNVERFGDSKLQSLPFGEVAYDFRTIVNASVGLRGSMSYHAPSFYSLFWNDELLAQGNPDLRAESSTQFQTFGTLSTNSRFKSTLDVVLSDSHVRDLIYWRQTFDGRWTPQNLKSATLASFAVSISQVVVPRIVSVGSSMEWLEARDRSGDRLTDGKYLIYRPARTFRGNLTAQSGGFHGTISTFWSDKQAVLETNSKWLPEYTLVNTDVARCFSLGSTAIEVGVRCENVFDVDYRVVRHAPMPLRQFWMYVNLKWM
ncbi:TonB-dependent receptor plug domain-containing protein [bacterium]|nr:TonB-dependent receptor plug domain-containing protein [bacterium]